MNRVLSVCLLVCVAACLLLCATPPETPALAAIHDYELDATAFVMAPGSIALDLAAVARPKGCTNCGPDQVCKPDQAKPDQVKTAAPDQVKARATRPIAARSRGICKACAKGVKGIFHRITHRRR